jgi:hypothetical protein
MKLLAGLLASQALADDYERCFEAGNFLAQGFDGTPIGEVGESSFTVANGSIECRGSRCRISCDQGYHFYGGVDQSKCRREWVNGQRVWKWNKNIAECKTCDEFNAENTDLEVERKIIDWGNLNAVRLTCPRDGDQLIKPVNVYSVFAICKCIRWPIHEMDRQNKCHWRAGTEIVDDESDDNSFYKKYWCNIPPSDEEETTTSTTTTTTTTTTEITTPAPTTNPAAENTEVTADPLRIPPGLVCRRHQQEEEGRIIGGLTAIPNSWPWIVDLSFGRATCAGTIIDDKSILTAAHCCIIQRNSPDRIQVTIGQHNKLNDDAGQLTFNPEEVIMHPNYNSRLIENDLCILKFNSDGDINLRAHNSDAVCLPSAGDTPAHGTRCWAAGWGLKLSEIQQDGKVSMEPARELQEVDLQIYSHEECERTENSGYLTEFAHLCAGWPEGGKDGCQGDSGGPLICADEENQPVLVGVTSWGFGCAEPGHPGVWARVSSYVDWIEENMN